jgi:hypothetical protein
MGCCQTTTMVNRADQVSPIKLETVTKLEVTIFPKLIETVDKLPVLCSPALNPSIELELPTQMNTPKCENSVVFVLIDKDIEYKVPKLLAPDSASTILSRRRKNQNGFNFDDLLSA